MNFDGGYQLPVAYPPLVSVAAGRASCGASASALIIWARFRTPSLR